MTCIMCGNHQLPPVFIFYRKSIKKEFTLRRVSEKMGLSDKFKNLCPSLESSSWLSEKM